MKCPRCNGDGSVPYHIADDLFDETNCPLCGGSGEVMTEQEYIQTCDTEQLAEELHEHFMWGVSVNAENGFTQEFMDKTKNHILEWLKQPHQKE